MNSPNSLRSASVSLASQGVTLLIVLVSAGILGRLLTPIEFGLFAIVLAIERLVKPLMDFGLTPAFLKSEDDGQATCNLFFTLNVMTGGAMMLFLLGAGGVLSWVYGKPILFALSTALAISALLTACANQPIMVLSRQCRFEMVSLVRVGSMLGGQFVAIGMAAYGRGVWSLAGRALTQAVFFLLLAHIIVRRGYRLVGFSQIRAQIHHVAFGGQIVASRLINGARLAMDRLLISGFYGTRIVGFYDRALMLAWLPDSRIRATLALPILAHLARGEQRDLSEPYRLLVTSLSLTVGFACLVLTVVGDRLLPWLMGPQWLVGGVFLQILGLWGFAKLLHGVTEIIYINERRMRSWNAQNLLSFPLILVAPVLVLVWRGGEVTFVFAYSLAFFVFWTGTLLVTFWRLASSVRPVVRLTRSLLLSIGIPLAVGFTVKYLLIGAGFVRNDIISEAGLVLVCLAMAAAVPLAVLLGDRRTFCEVLSFVAARLHGARAT